MENLYRYTVAGHTFAIEMPAELDEKMVLKPYLPFKEEREDAETLFALKVKFVASSGALPVGRKIECFNDDAPFMWLFESGQPNTAAVQINPLGKYVFGFSNTKSHSDCYLFVSEDMRQAEVCLPAAVLDYFKKARPEVLEELSAVQQICADIQPLIGGHHGEPIVTALGTYKEPRTEELGEEARKVLYAEHLLEFVLTNCMMLLYTYCTAPYDTLMTHSSVIQYEGKGYMFLGKSGTGKSTHSSLWLKYIPRTELLNDDNPVIRVMDGEIRVYGTPWSGKTPCYKNMSAPIGGIVRLTQAPENKISRLHLLNAFAALMPSCSCMKWDHDSVTWLHKTLEKVVTHTPIYSLECRPDEEAAQLSFKTATANAD